MFENTAIKLSTSKLASTSVASLLPGTVIIISGIIVWRLWYNQAKLQTKTSELNDELKHVKKHMAEIKATNEETNKKVSEFESPISSSFKKMSRFNPWSADK